MTCLYGDRDEDKGQSGYERRAGHPLHERRFNLQGFTTKAWNDFCKDGCNHQKKCGESAASENKWTITVNALRIAKTRSQPRATETYRIIHFNFLTEPIRYEQSHL